MAAEPGACDHSETMSITIQLLGRPRITWGSAAGYKFRSRKSWGLLAYLILSERPAARSQLASLLFAEADDPVRAPALVPGRDQARAGRRGIGRR